ncbi:hypothetical protein PBRA_000074 [Plasmodiophora brassicae]|uniref:60S ribosomal protein L41 n=1 Tax=Plasmodiophora brassicae TaxID=37360 RepID=A0A0G4IGI7_PLABS|nr:hypothetical protein PBRA_000074 [Plasmodiophora brassicae]
MAIYGRGALVKVPAVCVKSVTAFSAFIPVDYVVAMRGKWKKKRMRRLKRKRRRAKAKAH